MIQMPAHHAQAHTLPGSRADPLASQSPYDGPPYCRTQEATHFNHLSFQGTQKASFNPTTSKHGVCEDNDDDLREPTSLIPALPHTDSIRSPAPTPHNRHSLSSGEQSGVTGCTTTSQITTIPRAAEPSTENPFRNPAKVPKCSPSIFVYPHSGEVIGPEFHCRFLEVINIFIQNTEEDPRLREHVQHVDYTLRMCGPSPKESHPSILVFCRPSEFSDLRSLLTRKELKFQYHVRRTPRKYSWRPWTSSRSSYEPDTAGSRKPLFNLYFWSDLRPKSLLWGVESEVLIRSGTFEDGADMCSRTMSLLTMCGSTVTLPKGDTRSSTIGCVIQIGSCFYGITASHAVRPLTEKRRETRALEPSNIHGHRPIQTQALSHYCSVSHPENTSPGSFIESDDYSTDVEYESLTDEEGTSHEEASSLSDPIGDSSVSGIMGGSKKFTIAISPSPDEPGISGEMDLDWALVKLEHPGDKLPNACVDPQSPLHPVFPLHVAKELPSETRPVLILTGYPPSKKGTLQPVASVLGGINRSCAVTVWTVIPSSNSLGKGDSGSLVVDAQTYSLYGQVVATNPLGEIYISPLTAIMKQIQQRFPNEVINLPEPFHILRDLILYHIQQQQKDTAMVLLNLFEVAKFPGASESLVKESIDSLREAAQDKFRNGPDGTSLIERDTVEMEQPTWTTDSDDSSSPSTLNISRRLSDPLTATSQWTVLDSEPHTTFTFRENADTASFSQPGFPGSPALPKVASAFGRAKARGRRKEPLPTDRKRGANRRRLRLDICLSCKLKKIKCDMQADGTCSQCEARGFCCIPCNFNQFRKDKSLDFVAQSYFNHVYPSQSYVRKWARLHGVEDFSGIKTSIQALLQHTNSIQCWYGKRLLYTIDLKRCVSRMSSWDETPNPEDSFIKSLDEDSFIKSLDESILRTSVDDWIHFCDLSLDSGNENLKHVGRMIECTEMSAWHTFTISDPDLNGQPTCLDPTNDRYLSTLLTVMSLSRLILQRLENAGFDSLHWLLNSINNKPLDPLLVDYLRHLILSLRWRYCLWRLLPSSEEKDDFSMRTYKVCRTLYFHYLSVAGRDADKTSLGLEKSQQTVWQPSIEEPRLAKEELPVLTSRQEFDQWLHEGSVDISREDLQISQLLQLSAE